MEATRNKIGKFLKLKKEKQCDLITFLNQKGVKISRQLMSYYATGKNNPRRFSKARIYICEFFGLEDKEIFDNSY